MRIHHLNCGTMCPYGGALFGGEGSPRNTAKLVCHVLLVEQDDGLLLVDTGFGTDDVRTRPRASAAFRGLTRPKLELAETAVKQVQALGFDPADVRHIALTHLDIDHNGGLPDFPQANVHVYGAELAAMRNPPMRESIRYLIAKPHVAHSPRWVAHQPAGEEWFGFESVTVLGDGEVLLVPLPGHSIGHTAVAVKTGSGWLLHCGDAYFYRDEVATPPHCPAGLQFFQDLVGWNGKIRRQNQERLRELVRNHSDEVTLICSHDPVLYERSLVA